MIHSDIGIYYDMIYVLSEHFNSKYENKWLDLKGVSDCILPFFYKSDKGYSFMQNIFAESYEELLINENIEVIQNKLIDCENSVNRIIDYYFGDVNIKFVFNDFRSLYDLNKVILKSKYPDELKSSLYSLFIEPVKTVHELMRTLLELNLQLKRMYENHSFSISKIHQGILEPKVLDKLNLTDKISDNTVCAVSLLDKEVLKVFPLNNGNYLLLIGEDYSNNIDTENRYDLKDFGYVLTEINRLKLLDMMKTSGEITIKDIEQQLCLSGTNAYYHLSSMTKPGMVNTRYEGRTVFYSINKEYFKKLCKKLYKYSE